MDMSSILTIWVSKNALFSSKIAWPSENKVAREMRETRRSCEFNKGQEKKKN